jgi:hypothetical protein
MVEMTIDDESDFIAPPTFGGKRYSIDKPRDPARYGLLTQGQASPFIAIDIHLGMHTVMTAMMLLSIMNLGERPS